MQSIHNAASARTRPGAAPLPTRAVSYPCEKTCTLEAAVHRGAGLVLGVHLFCVSGSRLCRSTDENAAVAGKKRFCKEGDNIELDAITASEGDICGSPTSNAYGWMISSEANNQSRPLNPEDVARGEGLTALELDALTELINIGVSRAANSLRELIGEEVVLTVPSLAVLSRAKAAKLISQGNASLLVAVRQAFQGEFSGCALLIFPEQNSLELVRAVTKGEVALNDVVELEQEALAEIGNIILNGCMATIANLLERSLTMSLPEVVRGWGLDFLELSPSDMIDGILFVHINFSLRGREISGYVAIVMDFLSLTALRGLVAGFVQRAHG